MHSIPIGSAPTAVIIHCGIGWQKLDKDQLGHCDSLLRYRPEVSPLINATVFGSYFMQSRPGLLHSAPLERPPRAI